jgi:hypothetical protein
MRVLVLGGYGNFGARICRALAHDPAITLLVAGRNLDAANVMAQEVGGVALRIDSGAPDLGVTVRAVEAGLVIHTAGPFQEQGYGVARAAAAAGSHYIDLADGRRFVCDFAQQLDAVFRKAGRCAITGVSTVPALSSAVVDTLRLRCSRLDAIDCCIAPAQRAPRGVATVSGVLSYCGAPVRVWLQGCWQSRPGWADPQPVPFARLGPRRGALCDIPDLELFPQRYPAVQEVMFRAALEVGASQWCFALLSWLHRRGWLEQPWRLAGLLHRAGAIFDVFGSATGGMVVRVRGADAQGRAVQWAWEITAPNHHGPEIPCMAAVLLARKIARGQAFAAGAQACMGLLTLGDFAPEFARWGMATDVREESVHHGA